MLWELARPRSSKGYPAAMLCTARKDSALAKMFFDEIANIV